MRVQGLLGDSEARPEASKAAVARGLSWLQCLMLFASSSFLCVLCTSMMTFLWERRKGSQSQVAATCKSEQGEPMCRPSTQTAFPGEAGHLGKDCKTQHSGPSFQGGKTARPNKPAQQMQHARGFIVGYVNG